jgi:hypothetical protein
MLILLVPILRIALVFPTFVTQMLPKILFFDFIGSVDEIKSLRVLNYS